MLPVPALRLITAEEITELAVTEIVHGRPVKNREALANPEALELYRDLAELRS